MDPDITPQQALELIEGYRKVPNKYIKDVYGDEPWATQQEIVDAVFNYREVAVKTCNAVGKSFIAARIAHAFLDLLPGSLVVTTAPTWRQVKDVLWREFSICHSKANFPLGGDLTQVGFEYDKDWYAVGLSTKYPENFFGYHADHILVIVDEAGGVPEPIFKGVKAITPNVNAHVLYIGNPTDPSGTFYDAFQKPTVKQFTVSAFDTPNFEAAGVDNLEKLLEKMTPPEGVSQIDHKPFADIEWPYPALISPDVVFERFHEWGTESPTWQALVMGEFPTQAENALIPMNLVIQSMQDMDKIDPDTKKTYAEINGWNIPDGEQEYGLDMARYGSDKTVLTPRRGGWVDQQTSWSKTGTTDSALKVIQLIDPIMPHKIKIDDTGNGGGTTDSLDFFYRERKDSKQPYRYQVMPYNFASAPQDSDKFHDFTSELFWTLRQQFMEKAISLPYDEELLAELTGRQYYLTPQKRIKIETKDEYKKRTGRKSPDKADSLALAFYKGSVSGSWTQMKRKEAAASSQPERAETKAPASKFIAGGLDKRY